MQRIDIFLVEHGLAESREQAKRLILAGAVTVNGNPRIKPGQRVSADAKVVVQVPQRYISRGGFKLEKALSLFDIDVENRVALDVGASTGGFTDCLLQHGAKFVYAVDVGYGQLAWKLRTHPQVQSIEKTNIRHLTPTLLKTSALNDSDNLISIAVIDVSFISLRTVLPSVIKILKQQTKKLSVVSCQLSVKEGDDDASVLSDNRKVFRRKTELTTLTKHSSTNTSAKARVLGQNHFYDIIALLKPQFEAGKVHVKKGGIVRDKQVHIETIENLSVFVTDKLGVTVKGLTYSPIHKGIGNIEYLLWLTIEPDTQERAPEKKIQLQQTTAEVVAEAHEAFGT
ncbi:TlyA family RNA methyltransferase [Candidatus Poribacteria bacterium]|nr:TlyA family RNA methyltransferase [Candidatus Poribacteria bacterium]